MGPSTLVSYRELAPCSVLVCASDRIADLLVLELRSCKSKAKERHTEINVNQASFLRKGHGSRLPARQQTRWTGRLGRVPSPARDRRCTRVKDSTSISMTFRVDEEVGDELYKSALATNALSR